MEEILLIIAGLIGGFLAGLLGVGGGVIYILILPSALRNVGICEDQLIAYTIANSLFAILIASFSGNIKSILKGTFMYKEIIGIGILNVFFGILGMKYIVTQAWYSKDLFNGFIILLLLVILIRMLLSTKKESKEELEINIKKLGITGAAAGFISSLSGLGGGIIIVPFLQNFFYMDIKKAKTISLGVIGLMALSLTLFNISMETTCSSNVFQTGLIVYPVTLLMSLGVIIGTPIGVKVSHLISSQKLKITFSLSLFIVILKKIYEIATSFGYL